MPPDPEDTDEDTSPDTPDPGAETLPEDVKNGDVGEEEGSD